MGVNRDFGRSSEPDFVSVTRGGTEILPDNRNRNWATITNMGDHDVYCAVIGKGMVLKAHGGNIIIGTELRSSEAFNGVSVGEPCRVIFQEAQ